MHEVQLIIKLRLAATICTLIARLRLADFDMPPRRKLQDVTLGHCSL